MSKLKSPLTLFFATLIVIALLALFGPEERSLGASVRVVYLHGAWVLAAELAFVAAAVAGLLGLIGYVIHNKYYSTLRHGYVVRKIGGK
jgi:uncharacterized integral membrane protein